MPHLALDNAVVVIDVMTKIKALVVRLKVVP
jgi:hypothetical protein